ncbi:MAG: hypothetical protein ACREQY_10455, partial [Candidatus Binatia bacterium]
MTFRDGPAAGEAGYALLSVTVVAATLLVGAAAMIGLTRNELWHSAQEVAHQRAFYVAEAGIEHGVARLEEDRATAATSTTYTFSLSDQAFGEGAYSVVIEQDPLYPSDPRRKLIRSTGVVTRQESVVESHAVVQSEFYPGGGCPLLFSDAGRARIVTGGAATTLFNGRIFSNADVEFTFLAAAAVGGEGTVVTRRNLIESGILGLFVTLGATLVRQGDFVPGLLHSDVLNTGIHFSNGVSGHGVQQAVSSITFPLPDYETLRRDARTIVVNGDNVPFGSWDVASGTWVVSSSFDVPASTDGFYYVEGNADLEGVQLLR